MIADLTLGALLILILGQIALIYTSKKNRRLLLQKVEDGKRQSQLYFHKQIHDFDMQTSDKLRWMQDKIQVIENNQRLDESKWVSMLNEHQGVFLSKMERVKEDSKMHLDELESCRTLQQKDFDDKLHGMAVTMLRRESEYKHQIRELGDKIQKAEHEILHQVEAQFSQWRERQKKELATLRKGRDDISSHLNNLQTQVQMLSASLFAQGQVFLGEDALTVSTDEVRKVMEPGRIKKVENLKENSYTLYNYTESGEIFTSNFVGNKLVCEVILSKEGKPLRGTQYSAKGVPLRQFEYDQDNGQVIHMSVPEAAKKAS